MGEGKSSFEAKVVGDVSPRVDISRSFLPVGTVVSILAFILGVGTTMVAKRDAREESALESAVKLAVKDAETANRLEAIEDTMRQMKLDAAARSAKVDASFERLEIAMDRRYALVTTIQFWIEKARAQGIELPNFPP